MKSCVFSGSSENLNTSMTIKLDDGRTVEVWISDQYADTATPKSVKEAYLKFASVADEQRRQLEEMAAKLGLKVVSANETVAEPDLSRIKQLPQSSQPQSPPLQIQPPQPVSPAQPLSNNNRLVSGRAADKELPLNINSDLGSYSSQVQASIPQYNIHSDTKPSQDLKEGEIAEIGIVKGRAGIDIAIPVRRTGKTGTTSVAVINSGGDRELQDRFKKMAEASKSGNVTHYGKEGYDVQFRRCGLCNGTGISMKKTCVKCNGAGEIQLSKF